MRTPTGRDRLGSSSRRTRPAAPGTNDPHAQGARSTDELVHVVQAGLAASPHETAVVVGLTDHGRVEAIEPSDIAAGEAAVLDAIRSVLQRSRSAALVVFTDVQPPQWVIQPCYLLHPVAIAHNPRGHV